MSNLFNGRTIDSFLLVTARPMDTSIDQIPIAQLQSRYGLERSSVYFRLSALKIKPEKSGRRAYINSHQLKLLDDLDTFVKAHGKMPDFQEDSSTGQLIELSNQLEELSNGHTVDIDDAQNTTSINGIAEVLATLLRRPAVDEFSSRLHLFQDACDHGWLLRTSELAQLLQLNPKSLIHHKSYQRYGFTFTKLGRSGVESGWEISKN